MNEFLRKFDTIKFVAPWSIFRNFLGIFHFLNLNLNFDFGPVWYRTKPEPGRTGLTGNRSNRTGYRRLGKPWSSPPIEHQATNMLQQSCASLVLVCHFGIGIVYLSHNRPEQMTNSDVLNSTRSISLPLLISYPVFFPLSGLTPILSRLPERDVTTSWCTS